MPNASFALRHARNCTLALGLILGSASASADTSLLFADDYAQVATQWRSVNDGVMGGISKGEVTLNELGHLVFAGELSLENNGGFASIRTRDQQAVLDGNDTITVRVKGDGRTYYLSLRDKNRAMAASHRLPVKTVKGKWIDVTAKLSDFTYTRFGRTQNRGPLTSDEVIGLGFTLADKNPGPFKLQIASITADKGHADESADTVQVASTPGDILDLAMQAGQFNTLLTALKTAGLDEALRGQSAQLTVFAPTDAAFAKLPEGTVETLLKPENRDQLKRILLNHLVMDRVTLTQHVKTLDGGTVDITPAKGLKIGDASVLKADINATNGIIHVIDSVLLPSNEQMSPHARAMRVYDQAIAQGIPAYNNGDPAKCAEIYLEAVTSLMHNHRSAIGHHHQRMLKRTMQAVESGNHSAQNQAWVLRGALDEVYMTLSEQDDR